MTYTQFQKAAKRALSTTDPVFLDAAIARECLYRSEKYGAKTFNRRVADAWRVYKNVFVR